MHKELIEAINGKRGDLDAWLEVNNEVEVKAAMLSAIREARREALDLLRDIREWDIAQTKKNIIAKGVVRMTLPLPIRQRLQELIEREAQ